MNDTSDKKLEQLIKPVVEAMGYVFWGLEVIPQKGYLLLRVYVDLDQGVNLNDLSRISDQLNGLLDVEDLIMQKYTLEVSSPGLDRPLFVPQHYQQFVGEKVKIKLSDKESYKRHNYLGVLKSVTFNTITIISDGEEIVIPFNKILKAYRVYQHE